MNTIRKNEIKAKAKEINSLAESFQLIHASYAVEEQLKEIIKKSYNEKLNELNLQIARKIENNPEKKIHIKRELEEKEQLEKILKDNLFSIRICYINMKNPNAARVVKTNGSFIIYLAKSLKDEIFKEDGSYNYKVINQIRTLMSHELGHLVFHTKDLLSDESLQGSLNIKDPEKEEEANLFGQELLRLRRERNKQIRNDGGAEKLF